jgi:hypothetical protein
MCNVVCHIEGGKQADVFREYGAEEDIWDIRVKGKEGSGEDYTKKNFMICTP